MLGALAVVLLVPLVSLVKLDLAETLFTKVPFEITSKITVKLAELPLVKIPSKVQWPSPS